MKGVIYYKNGSPDMLTLREIKKPVPQDDEVLVRIYATSVNAADYRSMRMGIIPKSRIFGADIAGKIEAIGKNIQKFKVGDEVLGDISSCGFGGFAEYVAVPEKFLALKPAGVSFEDAAAVPMSAVTALQALREGGNIQPGQKVLICDASGGVGTFAVQLAKFFDAEVTAVCSEKNVELIRSLGADHVIDYSKEDFSKIGKLFNLIVAVNGNRSLSAYKRVLAPHGIFVMVGGAFSQVIRVTLFGAFMSIGNRKIHALSSKPNVKDLEFIIKLVEEGKIKPVIEKRYPLNETSEAMHYLSQGHAHGKVIIQVVQA
ncbi:MAG: NAD(P)-dependent alcohol dehydrogenase [Flexilinea sp.]